MNKEYQVAIKTIVDGKTKEAEYTNASDQALVITIANKDENQSRVQVRFFGAITKQSILAVASGVATAVGEACARDEDGIELYRLYKEAFARAMQEFLDHETKKCKRDLTSKFIDAGIDPDSAAFMANAIMRDAENQKSND